MKNIYKFLFLFLLPLTSIAQSNYKPGYVVTLKGDTLHGFIDYKEWGRNPKDIRFKNSLSTGAAEGFSTKNAGAFAVTGLEYYQCFVLSISQDQVDMGKLETKPDSSYLTDTVFLRIIAKGKHLTLYSYTDNIKPRYYVLETGENLPQELSFHAYFNPNESASVQYINRFRTQLENLAQKYEVNTDKTQEQIVRANYAEADLIKIADVINGTSSRQFNTQKLFGTRLFIGIGVNYNTQVFAGDNTSQGDISFPQKTTITPKISAGLDFFPNKNVQRLFLRAEVSFTVDNYNLSNTMAGDVLNLSFNQYMVSVIPQIFYNVYNTESLKVFLNVGVSVNFSSYKNYSFTEQFGSSSGANLYSALPLDKTWESFPIKAGIILNKKLEIYAGYTPSESITGVLSSINTVGSVSTYQAGISYLFGIK